MSSYCKSTAQGLIEVLIAIFILSVSLIGLMHLQLAASKHMQQADAYSFKTRGYTLIEVMLGLALSLLIGHILLSFIWISKMHYEYLSEYGALLENGRLAMSIVSQMQRSHGYLACQESVQPTIKILAKNEVKTTKEIAMESDVLWVQGMYPQTVDLLENIKNGEDIKVSKHINFKPDELLMISDCDKKQIFKVGKVQIFKHQNWLHSSNELMQFKRGAEVGKYMSSYLFVAKTKRYNQAGLPIYALYKQDITGKIQEMVEGVTYMQMTYTAKNKIKTKLVLESIESILDPFVQAKNQRLQKTIEFSVKLFST